MSMLGRLTPALKAGSRWHSKQRFGLQSASFANVAAHTEVSG